jgi:hypothetical protein
VKYGRDPKEAVEWSEENCAEGNGHIEIQGQGYFLSGDGDLMPSKKGQSPLEHVVHAHARTSPILGQHEIASAVGVR